jgi:hypothetical protein
LVLVSPPARLTPVDFKPRDAGRRPRAAAEHGCAPARPFEVDRRKTHGTDPPTPRRVQRAIASLVRRLRGFGRAEPRSVAGVLPRPPILSIDRPRGKTDRPTYSSIGGTGPKRAQQGIRTASGGFMADSGLEHTERQPPERALAAALRRSRRGWRPQLLSLSSGEQPS